MKKVFLYLIILVVAAFSNANAQQTQQLDPLKQNVTYNIDNLGDAHVEFSRTFNASQWDNYKRISGSNGSELWKREMEREFPAAYLQNFNYKEDDRSFTLTFDALGLSEINDNGEWQIPVGLKNPDITKISDKNYVMTATYNSGGSLLQQMTKINLPDGAANVVQGKDPFGKAMFTYDLTPGRKGAHMAFLIAGFLLIAAGVVLYFKPKLPAVKSNRVKPFTVVTSAPQQAASPAATTEPPAPPGIEKQA
ncbi:MAG TPA: hypothetical protein VHB54_20065 [Mucilaginibacter sp.]|nr:hypothetical protein [Mucilaginibacter sp.]